jgi:coenzyme F420-reducing hydrogenase alpha subunit
VRHLPGVAPPRGLKALDIIVGAQQLTPTAEKLRRLMHYGQILQSHALHFFHLSSPDLLFGFDSDGGEAQHRRRVAAAHPDIAKKGVLLRKYGQEVIRHTAGKRVHGTGSVPGGVNKNLTRSPSAPSCCATIDQMVDWSRDAVGIVEAAPRRRTPRSTTASAASARTCWAWCAPTARSTSTTAACAPPTPRAARSSTTPTTRATGTN